MEMTREKKTGPMLKRVTVGTRTHGFVEGPLGYIVCDTDFCHQIRSLRENVDLESSYSFPPTYQLMNLDELRALAEPIISFREWGHYWGIKSRIHSNYRLLLDSMRGIGADTAEMPAWGEEPKAA